jgi:hypothetical protein
LGPYGSLDSHEAYRRQIAEWQAESSRCRKAVVRSAAADLTINELVVRWDEHATRWYTGNGTPTHEYKEFRYTLVYLIELYGKPKVGDFGPLAQLKWTPETGQPGGGR